MYHYISLGVIIGLNGVEATVCPFSQSPNNPCLMWVQSRDAQRQLPREPQAAWISSGQRLFSIPSLVEGRAEMQNRHLMSQPSGLSLTVQRYRAVFLHCWL